jgi:hypothetical protein
MPPEDLRDVNAAPMETQALRSQAEVAYGPSEDPFTRCGNCQHFQAPNRCELVEPPISEDGVCDLFTDQGGQP